MKTTSTQSVSRPALPRRSFLRASALAAGAALTELPFAITTHAANDDPIRIGLIGCGGRGTGALLNALGVRTKVIYPAAGYHTEDVAAGAGCSGKNIKVVALADVFPDRLNRCRGQLRQAGIEVPPDQCFTGFDAYRKLLAIPEINYVIQATPPHFRPAHTLAAIEAGKNIFIEKPAAVDPTGVRTLMKAARLAQEKNLGIVAGTQRRHQRGYIEQIQRIRDGELGELMYGHCYWNGGVIWVIERQPGWSDMEWQLRNWNYFTWLSGDHIVEQHVHNLDVMNWAFGMHPVKATGLGGRQARKHPIHGHIYDHFAVAYEYPNGLMMFSQCRQMAGTEGKVEEIIVGTRGRALGTFRGNYIWYRGGGRRPWRADKSHEPNPYEQEHRDFIASIRAGRPLNEGRRVAESTLTGIMGRESCYSGQSIEWEQALNSKERLGPAKYEFGPLPFPEVAIPGKYRMPA
jgi:predicted dehydrogenase